MIVSMQKYPLMWKIFTFSSSFPKSPHHFLLKNVFCSHHWQMDIACRALLNAECHQTWPRQARRRAISLTCHNPWAVAPRCPLWQSLVLWPLLTTFVLFLLFLERKKKNLQEAAILELGQWCGHLPSHTTGPVSQMGGAGSTGWTSATATQGEPLASSPSSLTPPGVTFRTSSRCSHRSIYQACITGEEWRLAPILHTTTTKKSMENLSGTSSKGTSMGSPHWRCMVATPDRKDLWRFRVTDFSELFQALKGHLKEAKKQLHYNDVWNPKKTISSWFLK